MSIAAHYLGVGFTLATLLGTLIAVAYARRPDHALDVDELDRHFRSTPRTARPHGDRAERSGGGCHA